MFLQFILKKALAYLLSFNATEVSKSFSTNKIPG